MAAFAHIAAPQIRLTRDPNTLFFFLDHLQRRPPFRIEDDTTWDTNLELGIHWGLRLVEKDEELHGRSPNAKLFVMLSDGEAWSGEVAKSLDLAVSSSIPLFVIGVGTLAGGRMPVVPALDERHAAGSDCRRWSRGSIAPRCSALPPPAAAATSSSIVNPDRDIANAIVDAGRRLAPALGVLEEQTDLYWWFLLAGAAAVAAGLLFLHEAGPLWILLAGAGLTAVVLHRVLW